MAVTFKVPKSPSRDIELTDTFLGVDLTNTGVSIDRYRSPHAPNMIRNVPGKVRKRMGYYKEILFGKATNVNFAKDTSLAPKEIYFGSNSIGQFQLLYLLTQTLWEAGGFTIYLEFDYTSDHDFYIGAASNTSSVLVPAAQPDSEGNWPHFSGSLDLIYNTGYTRIMSNDIQTVYIRSFSCMKETDSSYEWSPAPKYFVERESNDPVYGCHFLMNGTDGFDGNRIVNVNRALKTADEYSWNIVGAGNEREMYRVAELPCKTQKIWIDFDYELSITQGAENVEVVVRLFRDNALETVLTPGSGHKSDSFTLPDLSDNNSLGAYPWVYFVTKRLSAGNVYGSIKITNFSLMYEKNNKYEWSPAPEDSKTKFYLHDMYNIAPKNYTLIESYTKETTSFGPAADKTEEVTLCNDDSHADGYQHISFDISTSITNSSADMVQVTLEVLRHDSDACLVLRSKREQFAKEHVELFTHCSDEHYIEKLSVTFHLADGSAATKAKINISNIVVKNFEIRDSFYVSSKWFLYHVGKQFYLRAHDSTKFTSVYEDANEGMSRSWQLNNNSYIIDGKDIYEFSIADGERVEVIDEERAYIPIVTDAKEPDGGGTARDPLNLLQPGFYEQFIGREGVTEYQLSFDVLDDKECKAWVLDSDANWNIKEEGTDFTVDRILGKIKFTTAPGPTPIEGEPSVKILAYRTVEDYRERITKCRFGVLFGVGGACDRIFMSGNPAHPNWDFYSGFRDGTYFPDTAYSTLGSEQSAITGYAIVSNYLATFKDGFDMSQSVFIREGDMLTDEETGASDPVFKLINSLQGEGAISPYSFGYLQTEPVFLTKAGLSAITEQDITGEKYSQNRSFYLDGKLRKEPNLKDAISTIYNDQYVLALNNQLYILDGLQATRTDKSEPYATRQYAAFYCTNVPAKCMWTDEQICFGTEDGRVCRFYSDEDAPESYNDDGQPIYACWETPDLDGKLFYKNKTFRYIAVRLMQAVKTSLKIYSRRFGLWTFIKEQVAIANILDFENFDFNLLSFSADLTERLVHSKTRVKKVDKARFRIENDKLNEPFGLFDLALEYVESGNYKG